MLLLLSDLSAWKNVEILLLESMLFKTYVAILCISLTRGKSRGILGNTWMDFENPP